MPARAQVVPKSLVETGGGKVQPMVKQLYKEVTRSGRRRPVESWHQIAPILRLDWRLTEHTSVQFGQQGVGVPFTKVMVKPLAFRRLDRVDVAQEVQSVDSVLVFTVRDEYQGYTAAREGSAIVLAFDQEFL